MEILTNRELIKKIRASEYSDIPMLIEAVARLEEYTASMEEAIAVLGEAAKAAELETKHSRAELTLVPPIKH